jgi:nucleoid DNA-binding protein/nucleoid-associated protein YgaU
MSHNISSGELADLMVKKAGIRKKMAVQILHAIPEVIEEGLKRDGEVRVKGMGTFRMTWIRDRTGRNPKTGEKVLIPAHYKLVFLPEQSFRDYVNRDFRLLSYKLIPAAGTASPEDDLTPEPQSGTTSLPEPETVFQSPLQPVSEPEPALPPELQQAPEPPVKKRRVHWIVPVAIVVIAVLSVVFYYRNFYSGGRRPEAGDRKPVAGSWQNDTEIISSAPVPEAIPEEPAIDSIRLPASGLRPPDSAVSSPEPADFIKHSTFNIQHSTLITSTEGKHLFQLAREVYENPYLWVLIYQANPEKIPDPDMLISGRELIIPALEGKSGHLSRNDSLSVAEGYRLVFDFYRSKNDPRADDFQRAYLRYRP